MTAPFRKAFRLVSIGFLAFAAANSRAASLQALESPSLWHRVEFRIGDGPVASNPFDPDEIQVDATFVAPSGARTVVPAFWFQDYRRALVDGKEVLTLVGTPEWRVRFTPTVPGDFTVTLTVTKPGQSRQSIATSRFTVPAARGDGPHGWVGIAPDHRNFQTSDGRILRVIGENVCWPRERGTFDYETWFEAMQRNGENIARLWMAPWWAPLEHVPGTLTHYRLDAAWELDRIFDLAEQHGIYLVFCFDHHGMYQVGNKNWGGSNNYWPANPYNVANGGPCATPNDFFTNAQAREIYEKRIRYLIGRYGSSPRLLAWQLMNEIDNVYGPLKPADVTAWHAAVGRWVHENDPFRHLVTTSLTGGSDRPEMWQLPEMDFSIYHSYADTAPARYLATLTESFERRYGKPLLIDEFGTSSRGWDIAGDPYLRGLRQGLWGGAVGGSTGTALPWWWEDIHASNAYPLWENLSKIVRGAGWSDGEWTPAKFVSPGEPPKEVEASEPSGSAADVDVPLGTSWRAGGTNTFAVTGPFEASRAAEQLNAYLRAVNSDTYRGPIRLNAWFASDAKVVVHVDSVADRGAVLVVRIDGRELGRTPLPDRDGRSSVDQEYNQTFTYEIPVGRHTVELDNTGGDWVYLSSLKLQRVLPATLAGGWNYPPEPIGVRQGNRAIVYVVSPWAVYPAGAQQPELPLLSGQAIQVEDWPVGDYEVKWYSPQTGRSLGVTHPVGEGGRLRVPLPDFDEDLAGVITPQ